MVGWHYRLNGHEFEQILGDGEGQGSLVCYSIQGHRVEHSWVTEQQQWQLLICGTKKKKDGTHYLTYETEVDP